MPAATYVAGNCAHASLKSIKSKLCERNAVVQDGDVELEGFSLVHSITRGGLRFPQPFVIKAALYTEIVAEKLPRDHASEFHLERNQRDVDLQLATSLIGNMEELHMCHSGHTPERVLHCTLCASSHLLRVASRSTCASQERGGCRCQAKNQGAGTGWLDSPRSRMEVTPLGQS